MVETSLTKVTDVLKNEIRKPVGKNLSWHARYKNADDNK